MRPLVYYEFLGVPLEYTPWRALRVLLSSASRELHRTGSPNRASRTPRYGPKPRAATERENTYYYHIIAAPYTKYNTVRAASREKTFCSRSS